MTQTTAMTGDDKHSTNKNGGLGMVYWVDHINGGVAYIYRRKFRSQTSDNMNR